MSDEARVRLQGQARCGQDHDQSKAWSWAWRDKPTAPVFSIVHGEYHGAQKGHLPFDLFRLKDVQELQGIGFGEYIDSGAYCFVEWPELAKGQLPPGTVQVRFEVTKDGTRAIHLEP
ncbi:MAG: tRNA (adenosine(37)-N6)-threonylcarbamoyltransferase complex ATPase subunit type 1 TsaE [Flavobacteriales bacterium]|nr:tRNA (adenosine(37)-N6)-threonylcarbamoyltransferase complex ATPase subunit type 1 TsaE [Flavobacteriales bacterium]